MRLHERGPRKEGPQVYDNWIAAIEGKPSFGAYEIPLFTDAYVYGTIEKGYGPYRLLNCFPRQQKFGLVQPVIVLRAENHIPFDPLSVSLMEKTDDELYHGGDIADEVAALISLSMGIRVKAGSPTRSFAPNGDPRGDPCLPEEPNPLLRVGIYAPILPEAIGHHSLLDTDVLSLIPTLPVSDAVVVIRVARLYQDGLWLSESDPQLCWLLLISAVETAAGYWRSEKELPIERLPASRPELEQLLLEAGGEPLAEKVAIMISDSIGSTKKFVDFIEQFLPVPPTKRPGEAAQHEWTPSALRKSLRVVYQYRSKALHGGKPFPLPMCDPPVKLEEWTAPAEIPSGLATSALGGTWLIEDTPILLHTFEYIVRNALLNWWRSLPSGEANAQMP